MYKSRFPNEISYPFVRSSSVLCLELVCLNFRCLIHSFIQLVFFSITATFVLLPVVIIVNCLTLLVHELTYDRDIGGFASSSRSVLVDWANQFQSQEHKAYVVIRNDD